MCFSAIASFTASTVLGVAGIASLSKAQQTNQKLFASIPLLFSVQQLAEGFIWLSLSGIDRETWHQGVIDVFLVFAMVVWPLWIGASTLLMETVKIRRWVQMACLVSGIVFAGFTTNYLINYNASARIVDYHILYEFDFPNQKNPLTGILYVFATIGPLLASSLKRIPVLGLMIFASYLITKLVYNDYVISIWCFFAALISGIIFLMVSNRIKTFVKISDEPDIP